MSLINIGLRDLPNLYVEHVHILQRQRTTPKMTISLVLKDVIVNNKLMWSNKSKILDYSKIVVVLEDKNGKVYLTKKEPLSAVLSNPSIEMDPRGNTVYYYKIEKIIDSPISYYTDKSLILKTYVESTNDVGYVYKSSIMREAIQNSDGSIPDQSFYFTLPSGQRYSGPFHYHEKSKSYMMGETHTSKKHPKLTLNYTKNRSITYDKLQKTLSYVNKKKNTYNFNPRTIIKNYITKNNDRSVSSLFIIDLYKILLTVDENSQRIYELNQDLFYEITEHLNILEMTISRVEMGKDEYDNSLYTPVIRSTEVGIDEHLMTLENVSEGKYNSKKAEAEVYVDDKILYVLATDNQIKAEKDGRFKYATDLKVKCTVTQYIKQNLSNLYSVIAYYDRFIEIFKDPKKYNKTYHKLTNSYIREIFGQYTDFKQVEGHKYIDMLQKPEFHKHIETVLDNMVLLKKISSVERWSLYDELDQMISPLSTNQSRIYNFLKICRDLVHQVRSTYGMNKKTRNKPLKNNKGQLFISLRNNRTFIYGNKKKSFKVFKKLKRPIISMTRLKNRFTIERSRYFQKNLGDTSFNLLPSPMRAPFKSTRESRYTFLSPISLQTEKADIDLEHFDIFDAVADKVYATPKLKTVKKINSNLTLLKKNLSHIDAAEFLSEASDFIINKKIIRRNVFPRVDPMVLNYSVPLNSMVNMDVAKFDLNRQENLLLSFVKNKPPRAVKKDLENLPFQTKSLFYPDNIKNPLNRIASSSNFKVKRLIKSVAFTTYKLEYLSGYRSPGKNTTLRSIHSPVWERMKDPSKIQSNAKYHLVKMSSNDKFGFRNSREFVDTQKFVLVKNNKYIPEHRGKISSPFQRKYRMDDFSLQSYETLNVLDKDIKKTTELGKRDPETKATAEWNKKKYEKLKSISNSSMINKRSRSYIKSKKQKTENKGKY